MDVWGIKYRSEFSIILMWPYAYIETRTATIPKAIVNGKQLPNKQNWVEQIQLWWLPANHGGTKPLYPSQSTKQDTEYAILITVIKYYHWVRSCVDIDKRNTTPKAFTALGIGINVWSHYKGMLDLFMKIWVFGSKSGIWCPSHLYILFHIFWISLFANPSSYMFVIHFVLSFNKSSGWFCAVEYLNIYARVITADNFVRLGTDRMDWVYEQ